MKEHEVMDCEEVLKHLDDYLDRELSADDLARLEAHLCECAHCAKAAQFEESMLDCIRMKIKRICAPKDLLDRIFGALDEPNS